jgi:uncharacterized membrane protein YfcA
MLELEWILSFLLLGAVVGFIAGLLGVGGGGIIVPMLTSIFLLQGVPVDNVMHLSLGTSMACIIITSISSLRAHHKKDAIIWNIVKKMSYGIIIGTFISTFIVSYINSLYLAIFFTVFMAYMAVKMLLSQQNKQLKGNHNNKNVIVYSTGIGAISALVSIGGGSLTVPYLVARNVGIKKAIGTSAAIGLPISLAGTIGYLLNGWSEVAITNYTIGFIYLPAFFLISLSSFFTAPYGVKAAHYLPIKVLKKIFAALLIIMSFKMLLSII